ncbi:hypothetical protein [Pseudomonas hormoni]
MDIVSKEVRSRMMAGIRGSNTSPEIKKPALLHQHGFRFRLKKRNLPSKPELVTGHAFSPLVASGTAPKL